MTKRVLIINSDGTAEVNGVKVRVVPENMPLELQIAGMRESTYDAMLSAAAIDLSSLPRVPERRTVQAIDCYAEGLNEGFNDALDAIGVKE